METALWVVIGILTARLLSVSDRGVYSTAIVVTSAAGSISSLSAATGYFVANRQRLPAEVAGSALVMVGPIAFAMLLGGAAMLATAGSADSRTAAFAVLSLAPQVLRNSTVGVLLGENALVKFNIVGDVPVILGVAFIGTWVGILDHRTALAAMQAWCAAQWLSLVPVMPWGSSWLRWVFSHRPSVSLMKSMLSFTGATGLGSIVALIHSRVDQLLIFELRGKEAAGIYSSAIAVAQLLLLFSASVTTAAFARVGRASREEAATLTATAVRHTVLVVIGGGLAAALAGPFLIELLFGRAYGEASTPLRILCIGTALYAPLGLLSLYFVNQLGRPQIPVAIGLGALATSLTAGVILIPPFGTAGAASATTISYACATAAALIIFLRRTSVPPAELVRVRAADIAAYVELGLSVLAEVRRLARRALRREAAPS